MIVMCDSTTPAAIPASAAAVAGYVGGDFHTWPEIVHGWPHALRLSIAVNSGENAECLDVEKGDATPADVPGWFHRQRAAGAAKPCFYSSASVVTELEGALAAAGIKRDEYRVWSAHYTGQPHICGPQCGFGLTHPVDGTQWTDKALGRNLDESLLQDGFFGPFAKPDALAGLTPKERATVERYDHLAKHLHLHPRELAQTRADVVRMRKETWLAAVRGVTPDQEQVQPGWDVHNRRQRYSILLSRTS